MSDGEGSDIHELLEEVISQLSTPFVTEISRDLDTAIKDMIGRLKLEYAVTTFHTLLALSANKSLMAFASSHKKLFIATYNNTISTSKKIKSKH